MKKIMIGLVILTSLPVSASLNNGVSAVLQTLGAQEMLLTTGVEDKRDSASEKCTVEVYSKGPRHLAVYVENADKRVGAVTGLGRSGGQISFTENKIIVQNTGSESVITLDENNLMKKVQVKERFGLGSISRLQCEL